MINDFIEPDVAEAVSIVTVLEKLPISSENKKWLLSLLSEDEGGLEQPVYFEQDFQELIKQINELDASAFKPLFLFDFRKMNLDIYKGREYINMLTFYPDCFDEDKLLIERIKILPDLFTKEEDGKPSVFKPYVARILHYIQNCATKDKAFSVAYQKKLLEIRAGSSFKERAVYYIHLVFQNLLKRKYEDSKNQPTPKELDDSFLDLSEEDFYETSPYSLQLVAELEGMSAYIKYFVPGTAIQRFNILPFPFILYGKEMYTRIYKAFHLLHPIPFDYKRSADDIAQLDIPRWNKKNYIHEVFFSLALALLKVSEDMSILILDRIFEGVNIKDIPYIFSEYIKSKHSSTYRTYGALLKEDNFEFINPVRSELEHLDWAVAMDTEYPYRTDFDKCRLFLYYLEGLSLSKPENKQALVPFIQDKTIKDILDFVVRERVCGEWTFPEQKEEAAALYEEFVDIIEEESVEYPANSFQSLEEFRKYILSVESEKEKLAVFKLHCAILARKSPEDALSVARFWFYEFHNHHISYSSIEAITNFAENEKFFNKKVFHYFINDVDFVYGFLSIPQEVFQGQRLSQAGQYWIIYYLACWIGYKNNRSINVFDAASQELVNKNVIFTDEMFEIIQSSEIFKEEIHYTHSLYLDGSNKEAGRFILNLFAALGGTRYEGMLKMNTHTAEEHLPLYLIRYRYSHEEFVKEKFLDFLFEQKNLSSPIGGDESYPLDLIRKACEYGVLQKQMVLEKVAEYIGKYRLPLINSNRMKGFISFFFIEAEKGKAFEDQRAFFIQSCERAVWENEDLYMEIYTFLKLRSYFRTEVDVMLEKHTENIDALITRCSKILNVFKSDIVQKEVPEDGQTLYNDYIFLVSDFLWEKTGNIWKALKPLILAFRASKKPLLTDSLNRNFPSPLFEMITSFFEIENKDELKELRYNMANDLADYLKPAKKERQEEDYTEIERKEQGKGFDLSYTEPSPFWRYAYIRALGDIGVKTDKRGHFFNELLKTASKKDPSEEVRVAARKAVNELNAIRRGYSGNNHKKCLFEAFWWLRQAHMLSLGAVIDKKKANELRIKEWR
jgi:hypothetical protein